MREGTKRMSTYDKFAQDEGARRLLEEETLILQGAELIVDLLEKHGVKRSELAERIGRSPSYVSQMLSGSRNMTLRTLAACCSALGARVSLNASALETKKLSAKRVYEFPGERPRQRERALRVEGVVENHRRPATVSMEQFVA